MLSENALFQVLVTSGNQALPTVGSALSAIKVGQIGIYNSDTNVAVDATTALKAKRFYIAVGTDPVTNGAAAAASTDVVKSSGQSIQAAGIKAVTGRCYTPEQPQIIDVTEFFAVCDRDYVLKFILTNQSAIRRYGKNLPYKSFVHHTSCCATTCTTVCKNFAAEVAYSWVNQINADDDNLLKAELLDYTNPASPVVVPIANYASWVAAHPADETDYEDSDPTNDGGLGVRITTKPSALANYCTLNMGYDYPRGTTITAALAGDFQCTGKTNLFQSMVYEEGAGYDIQQLESDASGWTSDRGHYRLSELNSVERPGYAPLSVRNGKYVMININAYHSSIEDRTYESNLDNIIAIPCGETATIAPFLAVLDAITNLQGGMDALADDLAACPTCTTVKTMRVSYVLDGIA